ncbi:MAG: translocation/assembly module TamB domain-containing protein, partial [Bacteroidota bacterium]|nr:translocation/assembly module TamB domain-containing protein [Bacteroidota bacterium]
LTKFFLPKFSFHDSTVFYCKYNSELNQLLVNATSQKIEYQKHKINNLSLKAISNDSIFTLKTNSSSLSINKFIELENFNTISLTANNSINLILDWESSDTLKNKGKVISNTKFIAKENSEKPEISVAFLPSQIIVYDSIWQLTKSRINIDSTAIRIDNFKILHNNQMLYVDGAVSQDSNDSLFFDIKNIDLSNANILIKGDGVKFDGLINGKANISDIYNNPLFYSDIEISNFSLNNKEIGNTEILSLWNEDSNAINIDLNTRRGDIKTISANGNYFPKNRKIDFDIDVEELSFEILEPFLDNITKGISGLASGHAKMTGTFKRPVFNGAVMAANTSFMIDYLKTNYNFTNNLKIENNSIIFKDVNAFDKFNNKAIVNGRVNIPSFKNITYDFSINADNFFALNTTGNDNETFYGTAFMSGLININGVKNDINIDISAKTEKNTKINIPLSTISEASESSFISFVNPEKKKQIEENYKVDLSGFKLNFDLEITSDAEAQLIFDSKIGDVIKAYGDGNLKMEITSTGDFNMFGEYNIVDGDYLFTLQNVINKKFDVERGSKILWNGDPYNANIDVKANYKLKAPLSGLLVDTTDYYKKRIPIECQIFLTENLMNPSINFNIDLPSADEDTKTRLRSAINTQEQMNKQFLALLVINNFLPDPTYVSSDPGAAYGTSTLGFGQVTTSELLSNQLSHWLSQISDEWDFGVNYRPGDELSQDQVEVALSTQLLNDRIIINGNVGNSQQNLQTQTSDIVGDFDLEIKLNESGKLRFKAFNRANDKLIYKESLYTQGVGFFYREEFNSLKELFRKIFNPKGKKEDEIKIEDEK